MPDKTDIKDKQIKLWSHCKPALRGGTYTITVDQKLSGEGIADSFGKKTQTLHVAAPRFSLDPKDIHSHYPAHEAAGDFSEDFPYIVFAKRTLPWERSISSDQSNPPWLALVLFLEREVSETYTATVENLLKRDAGIFVPEIYNDRNITNDKDSCRYIEISLAIFDDLLPRRNELAYLAHAREVDLTYKADFDIPASAQVRHENAAHEDGEEPGSQPNFSIVMANRLPLPGKKHIVHLVSLEGHNQLLDMPFSIKDRHRFKVRLISLASWSFQCTEGRRGFGSIVFNLVKKDREDLRLCLPSNNQIEGEDSQTEAEVSRRLKQGYVPLPYHLMSGEDSFAWYRGPIAAIPEEGNVADLEDEAYLSASSAMRFDTATGIFDQTYAVAWQLGRSLALADPKFGPQLMSLRRKAHQVWDEFCERLVIPDSETKFDQPAPTPTQSLELQKRLIPLAQKLIEIIKDKDQTMLPELPGSAFDNFLKQMTDNEDLRSVMEEIYRVADQMQEEGPGSMMLLSDLLVVTPDKELSKADQMDTHPGLFDLINKIVDDILNTLRDSIHPDITTLRGETEILPAIFKAVLIELMDGMAVKVLTQQLSQELDAIVQWINNISLMDIPFYYLVPHPKLLPPESLRFFFVDENWWYALFDGALSLAIHSTIDEALYVVMRKQWVDENLKARCRHWGLFLRSNLVRTWSGVELYAYKKNDEPIAPLLTKKIDEDLLLFLFEQPPNKLELREPKEGIRFGIKHTAVATEETLLDIPKTIKVIQKAIDGELLSFLTRQEITQEELLRSKKELLFTIDKNVVVTENCVLDIMKTIENMKTTTGNTESINSAQFVKLLLKIPKRLILKAP